MKVFKVGQCLHVQHLTWKAQVGPADVISYQVYNLDKGILIPALSGMPNNRPGTEFYAPFNIPADCEGNCRIVWCRNEIPEYIENFVALRDTGYAIPAWVVEDIVVERLYQDKKWGGPLHDDEHDEEEWLDFIEEQTRSQTVSPMPFRQRMVKIAALAVAAIESDDRKEAR